jgi:hypothetical protein
MSRSDVVAALVDDPFAYHAAEVAALLDDVIADGNAVARVARQSYFHENGFLKIVLQRGQDGRALRLHLWSGREESRGTIHNHCWDFTSHILVGALGFEEYVADATAALRRYHFQYTRSEDLRSGVRPCGQGALRLVREGQRHATDAYHMEAPTLHRTWGVTGEPTVSVIVQGPRRQPYADVYTDNSAGPASQPSRVGLDEAFIRDRLLLARGLVR